MAGIGFPTSAPSPLQSGVIGLGRVYIGVQDEDPTILANRLSVTLLLQDGSEVVIAGNQQPFILNAGGMFQYNGSVVQLSIGTTFSMTVQFSDGTQAYYLPSVIGSGGGGPIVSDKVVLPVLGATPSPIANSGQLYTKNMSGTAELFYIDDDGNEIQFTEGGALKITLPDSVLDVLAVTAQGESYAGYFTGKVEELTITGGVVSIDWHAAQYFAYDNTAAHTIEFSNLPIIADGKGQTILLTIYNAGAFAFSLDPGTGYEVYRRSTDDFGDLTGTCMLICTVISTGIVYVVPLIDFVDNA